MFSLFPCDWSQPKPKGLFVSKQPVIKPIILKRPDIPEITQPSIDVIPAEEMCLGEQPVDTSEIDRLLAEMNDDSPDAKTRQIMRMISNINEHLAKNIKVLQNASNNDGDTVSRNDLIKLLQMFANYSHALENYVKTIAPVSCR